MKICLIGPGIMPIPPEGWGGVEHLIWNFHNQLKKVGDEVTIVNTQNLREVVEVVNDGNFDAVHLHYDQYAEIMPHLKCGKKMITSHYPYLENPEPQYVFLYDLLNKSESHVVSLSDRIKKEFVARGIDSTNVSVLPCGIDTELYTLDETNVLYSNKSIVVGKLEPRKRQAFLQHKDLNIDFIGNNAAGLGLVLSEQSTANLDLSQPFITVIPDDKLDDTAYLNQKIKENRKISLSMRKEIRKYCFDNFDWSSIINQYKSIIESI